MEKTRKNKFKIIFNYTILALCIFVVISAVGRYVLLHIDGKYTIGIVKKVFSDDDFKYEYSVKNRKYSGVHGSVYNNIKPGQQYFVIYSKSLPFISIMIPNKSKIDRVNLDTVKLDTKDVRWIHF